MRYKRQIRSGWDLSLVAASNSIYCNEIKLFFTIVLRVLLIAMDEHIDKLISAVRTYTPLWDMNDKRYHSRDIQRKLWGKVAEEMGSDGK